MSPALTRPFGPVRLLSNSRNEWSTGRLPRRAAGPIGAALILAMAALMTLAAGGAAAQEGTLGAGDGDDDPLEILADDTIEWRREEQQYVARGNVEAIRGDVTVFSDVMTAHYREGEDGGTEIHLVVAEGSVIIETPTQQIFGDRGEYDLDDQVALVTGDDLRLVTPDEEITARDSLEYYELERRAVARGDARALREDNEITADMLTAFFEEDADGALQMDRMLADGNVVIVTPQDIVQGESGTYNVATEIATLTGGVELTRGPNQLNGDRAEVNMVTGISQVFGGPAGRTDGRVRGLFVPGSGGSGSP